MAHKIRVKFVPGTNKDGKPSKTNGTWVVTDHTRGKTVTVAKFEGKKSSKDDRLAAEDAAERWRGVANLRHRINNPNDRAFRAKHDGSKK